MIWIEKHPNWSFLWLDSSLGGRQSPSFHGYHWAIRSIYTYLRILHSGQTKKLAHGVNLGRCERRIPKSQRRLCPGHTLYNSTSFPDKSHHTVLNKCEGLHVYKPQICQKLGKEREEGKTLKRVKKRDWVNSFFLLYYHLISQVKTVKI